MTSKILSFNLNGRDIEVMVKPLTTLQKLLREDLGYTATKSGCRQGGCGSCTVLVNGEPFMACLLPVEDVSGKEVLTLEGLTPQDPDEGLHPIQQAFYDKYAMVVAVCGMFGAKETNKYMSDILGSFGFNVVSALELQIALKTEKEKAYNHKQTVQAFDKFIAGIEKGQKKVPLGQIVRFNIFKVISESNKEHFEADYEYYKDKADFPYETNFFRKKWARLKALKALGEFMANR